jgi:hypothetical protein
MKVAGVPLRNGCRKLERTPEMAKVRPTATPPCGDAIGDSSIEFPPSSGAEMPRWVSTPARVVRSSKPQT